MFHLDEDSSRKSKLGGLCSLCVNFVALACVGFMAKALIMNETPYIQSVSTASYDNETIHINETS